MKFLFWSICSNCRTNYTLRQLVSLRIFPDRKARSNLYAHFLTNRVFNSWNNFPFSIVLEQEHTFKNLILDKHWEHILHCKNITDENKLGQWHAALKHEQVNFHIINWNSRQKNKRSMNRKTDVNFLCRGGKQVP